MSAPNGSVYEVVLSGQLRDKLKYLHGRAQTKGQGHRLRVALKAIVARLRTDPERFCEPRFVLAHLRLEVRVASVPPLVGVFGIDKDRPIVFIKDFLLLPGTNF